MTDATTNPELEHRIAERLRRRQEEREQAERQAERELVQRQAELITDLRDRFGDLIDVLGVQPGLYCENGHPYPCGTFSCRGYSWYLEDNGEGEYNLCRTDQGRGSLYQHNVFDTDELLDMIDALSQPEPPADPTPVARAAENTLPALFAEIETELRRIDQRHNNPKHSVGGWLVVLRRELREAEDAWACNDGDADALNEIAQVAAVAVACLRQHGQPLPL